MKYLFTLFIVMSHLAMAETPMTPLARSQLKMDLGISALNLPASAQIRSVLVRADSVSISYVKESGECLVQSVPLDERYGILSVPEVLLHPGKPCNN